MFINPAFAQTAGAVAEGSLSGTLIQLGLIFLIFYLLLIRPQQKKIKQHEAMLATIKKGDKIITGGGVYAKVVNADDPVDLQVEIANGVVVTVNRGMVRELLSDVAKVETNSAAKKVKAANSNKAKK